MYSRGLKKHNPFDFLIILNLFLKVKKRMKKYSSNLVQAQVKHVHTFRSFIFRYDDCHLTRIMNSTNYFSHKQCG